MWFYWLKRKTLINFLPVTPLFTHLKTNQTVIWPVDCRNDFWTFLNIYPSPFQVIIWHLSAPSTDKTSYLKIKFKKQTKKKKRYEKKISFSNYNKSIKKFSRFLLRSLEGGQQTFSAVFERGGWDFEFYVLERPRLSRSLTYGGKAGDHHWKLGWFERTTTVKDAQVSSSLPCISWQASAL